MTRHLAFIDRLLADKDKLSAKCVQLGKDIKVSNDPKHSFQITKTCLSLQ